MRSAVVFFLVVLFFSRFLLVNSSTTVFAGCENPWSLGCGPCPGPNGGLPQGQCRVSGNNVFYSDSCPTPPSGDYCVYSVNCTDGQSASSFCGGPSGPVCGGTCNSSACGSNGACSCNDFGWEAGCNSAPGGTCSWTSFGGSDGVCNGRYCCGTDCTNIGDRSLCLGTGCGWTPAYNSCADLNTCSGGTCQTACGDTASCTPPCINTGPGAATGGLPNGTSGHPTSLALSVTVPSSWGTVCSPTTETRSLTFYLNGVQKCQYTSDGAHVPVSGCLVSDLSYDTLYPWYVVAQNGNGLASTSQTWTFRTMDFPAWWQATEGDIYAGGTVRSQIPSGCVGSCQAWIELD